MSDLGVWLWLDNFAKPHYFRFKDDGRSACRKWMTFKKLEDADKRVFHDPPCKKCWAMYKKDGGTAELNIYGQVS